MKSGHRINGKVTGYDDKGRGIFDLPRERGGTYDLGKGTIAVPFSSEGDEIVATFVKRDRGIKVAKLETIISPGPDRVTAPCPHAGTCGGCLWQHISYHAQLRLKLEMINRAFENAGHEERVTSVMPSEKHLFYRNRMDYAVGWLGTLGLKEYGSWNRYIDLSTCMLLSEETPKILSTARELMKDCVLEPWDAIHHTGLVRYLVIREGKNTNQRLVMLVVKDISAIDEKARIKITERLSHLCTSLLLGEQNLDTDISFVQRVESLTGNPWIEEKINGINYRIAPNSFFQTNSDMAAKLQDVVLNALLPITSPNPSFVRRGNAHFPILPLYEGGVRGGRVLDLYCGLGFFGIACAKQNPDVTVHGFELDAEAIELAKHNATINGIADRTSFTSGPAEDLSWQNLDVDAVILDPPRAGLHPRVLKTVLEKKPKTIIYVSCNFHRLVEELKEFKKSYRVESIQALDMFPNTPHVEVVVKLVRST
jgi:tRNA/tmRNA/rRNA uracil-C5-methylase (TrmA/RlmC/RlmD family)